MEVEVRDDTSVLGLRRVEVIQGGRAPEAAGMAARAAAEGVDEADVGLLAWKDDLGMFHLRGWWRVMAGPMWCRAYAVNGQGEVEAVREAVGGAALRYRERWDRWPNRAVVRNGTQAPAAVALVDEQGETIETITIGAVGWISRGTVGVFREDPDDTGEM